VAHRTAKGAFANRAGLTSVKGIGAKTFQQAAGWGCTRLVQLPHSLQGAWFQPLNL
jgi:hypothetical protein